MMRIICLAALLIGLQSPVGAEPPDPRGPELFEKRIRPLLVENCYRCHSQEKRKRGGLHLDSRAAMLKGGDSGPAIVPGHPEKSLLIKAIGYKDPELRMPPKSKLAAEQIDALVTWVKLGAPAPESGKVVVKEKGFNLEERRKSHWVFQPLNRGTPPKVSDRAWCRSPLDQFILGRLEANGLSPAKETNRRTWIRRVTFDLIGLPPTPAEIDTFLNDQSPQAYEKVVDRLLASPHYGERWARHWLDLVRYAETAGHEFDFEIPRAFEYRDYVIRAFNQDLPYNQFVKEHVAGDLIKEPRRHSIEGFNESIIGTGFFHLGEGKHSPVDIRAEESDRVDNQIDVFSKTFLGLTVGCARCHDHKFDAISTRDYYALYGYMRSSRYHLANINPPEPTTSLIRDLKQTVKQANDLAVHITQRSLLAQIKELPGLLQRGAFQKDMQSVNPNEGRHWLAAWKALGNLKSREQFQSRRQALLAEWKKRLDAKGDYQVFADFSKQGYDKWFLTGNAFGSVPTSARDIAQKQRGAGQAHSAVLGKTLQGTLRSPTFTISTNRIHYLVAGEGTKINLIIDGFQRIRAPIYGGLTIGINSRDRLAWRSMDVTMWRGHRAYIECLDQGGGWISLAKVIFTDHGIPSEKPNANVIKLLDDPVLDSPEKLARKYQNHLKQTIEQWQDGELLEQILASSVGGSAPTAEEQRKLQDLERQAREIENKVPAPRRVLAMVDGSGENEHVFIRGNHKNLGKEVPRRFLEAIAGKDQPVPEKGSGRLALAKRMIDPDNPLLARVFVNRIWHYHFGRGIVASVDDFGVQGQKPTHPQLLDWLASTFMKEGWSMKKLHRRIVLSSTYRQSSKASSQGDGQDPENKLCHRMPTRRLEAEVIRDALLTVSGRIDDRMYGRGIMPHLTPHMTGRGRPGRSGPIDGQGRRSIYINVRRNFLTPLFLAFDYPVPFTTIGRRSVSNVPAQALSMMNNPFVRQQADLWARRTLSKPGLTPAQRVQDLYETAFGRPPTSSESEAALGFLEQQGLQNPRAWSELCHVLVNVKEFIFIN